MKLEEAAVHYPAGFEEAVQTTPGELRQQIPLMAALKMFELGKISSGKAAELADMTRAEFIEACARYKVSAFNYPDEELSEELKRDMEAGAEMSGS